MKIDAKLLNKRLGQESNNICNGHKWTTKNDQTLPSWNTITIEYDVTSLERTMYYLDLTLYVDDRDIPNYHCVIQISFIYYIFNREIVCFIHWIKVISSHCENIELACGLLFFSQCVWVVFFFTVCVGCFFFYMVLGVVFFF